jgi:hypothetical protein
MPTDLIHTPPPSGTLKVQGGCTPQLERLAQAATTPDEVDASVAMMQF